MWTSVQRVLPHAATRYRVTSNERTVSWMGSGLVWGAGFDGMFAGHFAVHAFGSSAAPTMEVNA